MNVKHVGGLESQEAHAHYAIFPRTPMGRPPGKHCAGPNQMFFQASLRWWGPGLCEQEASLFISGSLVDCSGLLPSEDLVKGEGC